MYRGKFLGALAKNVLFADPFFGLRRGREALHEGFSIQSVVPRAKFYSARSHPAEIYVNAPRSSKEGVTHKTPLL
jgi:hypothetical protein